MIGKTTVIFFSLAAALLCACAGPDSAQPDPDASPSPTPEVTVTPEPDLEAETSDAYRIALEILYFEHVLPSGELVEAADGQAMEKNSFAVCDVDGDGLNELIIQYSNTCTAAMTEQIYGYDAAAGELHVEFARFPNLTYYDNGVIKAGFSYNQGLAGRFWPFYLYSYNAAADAYDCVGMADAWDGTFFAEDLDGRPFPSEIDASGEGIVYYLLKGEDSTLGDPVDRSAYEEWLHGYIGGAREQKLPKIPLDPAHFDEGAEGTERLWLALDSSMERNYYSKATSLSKPEVERFALEVRRAILAQDWQALAGYIVFPLEVGGERSLTEERFYTEAPELFTGGDFTAALTLETCEEMFSNYEGIVMAGGRVHLAAVVLAGGESVLRVTAVNTAAAAP